jgi:hypothetical protein
MILPHLEPKFSRRNFCFTLALASAGALTGCGARKPSVESQLEVVYGSLNKSLSSEANLPGIQSLITLNSIQFGPQVTDDDLEILAGALYLETKREVEDIAKRGRVITGADVKAVLAKPIEMTNFGRDYFLKVLNDAKARRNVDSDFRAQLTDAQTAARKTCLGGTPRWICIGMGVVLVLGIILLL